MRARLSVPFLALAVAASAAAADSMTIGRRSGHDWRDGTFLGDGQTGVRIRQCRDFIGPDKDLLLGLYMFDFSVAEPVPSALMRQQLDFAGRFLADRTIDGLIFHPTFAAALDVPAVNLAKQWIGSCADNRWGV